jgi:YHS domain-containing protein
MKKTLLLISLSLLLVGGAFAGQKKAPAKPAKLHCAVQTGNAVDVADATKHHMYADYKGNRYFFCCGGCPEAFKAHPEKYAKSDHIKTPAKGK